MAAQIPIKDDKKANDAAMANVYSDKLREVRAGHDGTWVAHPALAAIASEVFNKHMPTPNQLFVRREDVNITANDLLNMNMPGTVTEEGIRKNLNIGLGYMEGWLRGIGCVPINYLMVRLCRTALAVSNKDSRKTQQLPKSAGASFGSGVGTTLPQLKARRSTRLTRRSCSRNRQTNWRRKRRKATNFILLLSTFLVRSLAKIMQIS